MHIIIHQIHTQTILTHLKNNGEARQAGHYDAQKYPYNVTKMSKNAPIMTQQDQNDIRTMPQCHKNITKTSP